jgi:vacuolar-type H+-ATPase subunit I/STV1
MRHLFLQPCITALIDEMFRGIYHEGALDDIPPEDIKDFLKQLYRLKGADLYNTDAQEQLTTLQDEFSDLENEKDELKSSLDDLEYIDRQKDTIETFVTYVADFLETLKPKSLITDAETIKHIDYICETRKKRNYRGFNDKQEQKG